ncbi:MAG TPA: cyclin-dependent kinase inhibitor 3 family protein [Gammaproteobacteria bacterium]|nr:cyclin-dependent kinase inhibitor 3 family protein [Gammaproteobacteria bacterium]
MKLLKPGSVRIDSVAVPGTSGRIGLSACPGLSTYFGVRARKLEDDLRAIRDWGAEGLVTLLENEELDMLEIRHMPLSARHHSLWWRHLPIRDMCAPDDAFDAAWALEGDFLRGILNKGGCFVVHCWAGLGRTGTVAARLLVEFGLTPAAAIEEVRDARPGAIQSLAQERYVQRIRPKE